MVLTNDNYDKGFFPTTNCNIPNDPTLIKNSSKLVYFVDMAHANDLCERESTIGIIFTFMGGSIVYKSKT